MRLLFNSPAFGPTEIVGARRSFQQRNCNRKYRGPSCPRELQREMVKQSESFVKRERGNVTCHRAAEGNKNRPRKMNRGVSETLHNGNR